MRSHCDCRKSGPILFEKVVSEQAQGSLVFVAKIIILYYCLSPFLYLLRTVFGDSGLTAILLRASQPTLFVITLFFACFQNRFVLNRYSLILVLLGLYGLCIAIFQDNKLVDLLGGLLHFATGLTLLIYFSQLEHLGLDRFIRILSYSTLVSYSLVIGLMYGLPYLLGFHIYLGLACQILIVVFFYHFQKKRFAFCVWAAFLILISGKRGVLVALSLGFVLSLLPFIRQVSMAHLIKALAFIGCVGFLLSYLPLTTDKLLQKYSYHENASMDDYSAGRWNEVLSAYDAWASSPLRVVFGSGFGFNYTYVHQASHLRDQEDYKNVHFSYLNPLIILGLPMALVYYSCLFLLFIKLFQHVNLDLSYLKWSSLTYLIYACFVFNLFDEPIFWMINGILMQYRQGRLRESLGKYQTETSAGPDHDGGIACKNSSLWL